MPVGLKRSGLCWSPLYSPPLYALPSEFATHFRCADRCVVSRRQKATSKLPFIIAKSESRLLPASQTYCILLPGTEQTKSVVRREPVFPDGHPARLQNFHYAVSNTHRFSPLWQCVTSSRFIFDLHGRGREPALTMYIIRWIGHCHCCPSQRAKSGENIL